MPKARGARSSRSTAAAATSQREVPRRAHVGTGHALPAGPERGNAMGMPQASALPSDRQVARWVDPLARIGYAAKGIVFILIGALALRAALAESSDARD